ncbi:MAG TPA: hypothetical protein VMZ91_02315 [Candidatus Paceibacterota bacterium]|nr:hypothetical protein [Candidatus Paceibacterota bacterium]
MNFEQWFDQYTAQKEKDYFPDPEDLSYDTWEACKKEVLRILKDKKRNYYSEQDGYDFDAIDLDAIEKIEKL